MKFLQLLVLFALLTLQSCLAEDKKEFDKEEEAHGIKVKVSQKSGRITIRKKSQDVKDAVEIVMDELSEYVDNITKVSNTTHSFKGFSGEMFAFTDTAKKYKDISAKTFNFTAKINSANLNVTVTIFNKSGTIENGVEKIKVKGGMVKTDISISNWVFCNSWCTASNNKTETGNILQFNMTIKGKSSPEQKPAQNGRKSTLSYDLGENVTLILPRKYKDNAVWKDMESGYPKLMTVESKKSFLFRFKKFSGTVFYDAISVYLPESTDENGDDSSAGAVIKVSVLLMVISLFINLI